jgi:hypothetical protein
MPDILEIQKAVAGEWMGARAVVKYFYDCEFLEDGKTIDFISIGIVAEDGREFYAVSNEFDTRRVATSRLADGKRHEFLLTTTSSSRMILMEPRRSGIST